MFVRSSINFVRNLQSEYAFISIFLLKTWNSPFNFFAKAKKQFLDYGILEIRTATFAKFCLDLILQNWDHYFWDRSKKAFHKEMWRAFLYQWECTKNSAKTEGFILKKLSNITGLYSSFIITTAVPITIIIWTNYCLKTTKIIKNCLSTMAVR